jgi:hypothetical protein
MIEARDRSVSEMFSDACRKATTISAHDKCVEHVNADLGVTLDGTPYIRGFVVTNWFDGSTVASFSQGERL